MYLLITFIRNLLYDLKILRSFSYDFEVVSVGNITVGGTGKTPHIEHFIRENLQLSRRVAVVSRGYKRKTKGLVLSDINSNADTIGDEPYQIFRKFKDITIAVDKDRINAIDNLLNKPNRPDIILLDDAFQYRRLKPQKQIVLIDYNRPIFEDRILPYGRLRESRKSIKRADEVIITKCPPKILQTDKEYWSEKLNLPDNITLRFSSLEFQTPKNIFEERTLDMSIKHHFKVITGVVNANSLYDYLTPFSLKLEKVIFPDHHNFTAKNIEEINRLADKNITIIVTEKDAAKLINNAYLSNKIKKQIYSVEIKVKFI